MRFKSFRQSFLSPLTAISGAIFLILASGTAQAACTDPPGNEGDMTYNSSFKTMMFCDGTD